MNPRGKFAGSVSHSKENFISLIKFATLVQSDAEKERDLQLKFENRAGYLPPSSKWILDGFYCVVEGEDEKEDGGGGSEGEK